MRDWLPSSLLELAVVMDNFPGWTYLHRQNLGRILKKKLGTLPS
jgi:hypothetical protein